MIYKFSTGHKTDAGLDISLDQDLLIPANQSIVFPLPVSDLNLPKGTCGIPFIRSKFAHLGLVIQPTIIDALYSGVCHIWAINTTNADIVLRKYVAYIQLVTFKIKPWRKVNGQKVLPKTNKKRGLYRNVTR